MYGVWQLDGAKMHPTEDNLRLVSVPSSAPRPTLTEPAAALEVLEHCLGRGAHYAIEAPPRPHAHVAAHASRRRTVLARRLRRAFGRREQGLVQREPSELAKDGRTTLPSEPVVGGLLPARVVRAPMPRCPCLSSVVTLVALVRVPGLFYARVRSVYSRRPLISVVTARRQRG